MPWLESLQDAIKECLVNKEGLILGCSALKKQYREILRSAEPDYKWGSFASAAVNFILLDAPAEVLSFRLNKRTAQGKHYMPASLLQSQLDLLDIDESEGIIRVDATLRPESIVNSIKKMPQFQGHFQSWLCWTSFIMWITISGFNNSCTSKMKIVLLFKKEMIQRDQQKINGKL